MKLFVKSGDKVILKPNLVAPRHFSSGATTNVYIMEEIIKEIKDLGGIPCIAESPGIEYDSYVTLAVSGIRDVAKEYGVRIIDLEKEERRIIKIPNGVILKSIALPACVVDADLIINVPKIKTHILTTVTLGLKNFMGLLDPKSRKRIHIYGLDHGIVDLFVSLMSKRILTVADGVVTMDRNGAVYGDKKRLGVIVTGDNVVATDFVCCRIMGIDPLSIGHLRLANEIQDAGTFSVHGETIVNVTRKFRLPSTGKIYKFTYGRVLFLIDYIASELMNRKTFLNSIFQVVGTRPRIIKKRCSKCGKCIRNCPAGAIENFQVNSKKCIRCMNCQEVCPQDAIIIKGITKSSA